MCGRGCPQKASKKYLPKVHYPHMPYRFRTFANNPAGSDENSQPPLKATAHASGIEVVWDHVIASILKRELGGEYVEYAVFNPRQQALDIGGTAVIEPFLYRSVEDGGTERLL